MQTITPILTRHAQMRAQQRGISSSQIELAWSHGQRQRAGGGRLSVTLTDRALSRCATAEEMSRSRGVRLIIEDGFIITVFHAEHVARRLGIARRTHLLEQLRQQEDRELLRAYGR